MDLFAHAPKPVMVMTPDGISIATYDFAAGEDLPGHAPVALAVHGFASSAIGNWYATGWVRELTRAGYRVLAMDQRGHGASTKPHEPEAYTMDALVTDVRTVIDTYLHDDIAFVGYSLGARVGWHAALAYPVEVRRAVLGGIPDGDPLTRFRVDQAKAFLDDGAPIEDRLTQGYLTMAGQLKNNDLVALVALVEGMRGGAQPDRMNPPAQPILFAAGSEDGIIEASRSLAEATPRGEFFEIPGRNHFNAPTSRSYREAALAFLDRTS
jgi:pimeloyl-ACP methyl ester carboxylesterase